MQFTIVIPSYNQAPFLSDCLSSVIDQTGVDLEVLVFDGGSNDGSREIIERYADRLSYWQSRSDGGQAAAVRAGFNMAKGDILGWVNSDDALLPGALKTVADCFVRNPDSPLVYGDAVYIDSKGGVIRAKREISFHWKMFAYGYCYLPQPSVFFRRDGYLRAGGIDPGLECCLDYDLWHRLVKLGPIIHVPAFLSCIRNHPGTKTNRLKRVFAEEDKILRRRYLHCSWPGYYVRHLWYRVLRVLLRSRAGCYRKMSANEISDIAFSPSLEKGRCEKPLRET